MEPSEGSYIEEKRRQCNRFMETNGNATDSWKPMLKSIDRLK
jgi:hypothetical protein